MKNLNNIIKITAVFVLTIMLSSCTTSHHLCPTYSELNNLNKDKTINIASIDSKDYKNENQN